MVPYFVVKSSYHLFLVVFEKYDTRNVLRALSNISDRVSQREIYFVSLIFPFHGSELNFHYCRANDSAKLVLLVQ